MVAVRSEVVAEGFPSFVSDCRWTGSRITAAWGACLSVEKGWRVEVRAGHSVLSSFICVYNVFIIASCCDNSCIDNSSFLSSH